MQISITIFFKDGPEAIIRLELCLLKFLVEQKPSSCIYPSDCYVRVMVVGRRGRGYDLRDTTRWLVLAEFYRAKGRVVQKESTFWFVRFKERRSHFFLLSFSSVASSTMRTTAHFSTMAKEGLLLVALLWAFSSVSAFAPVVLNGNVPTRTALAFTTRQHMLLPTAATNIGSSILTAVETFDGSEIVDPIVVSGIFWTSLKTKLLSVILGQFLAVIVFGLLSSLAATQIGNVTDFVTNKIFRDNSKLKMPPPARSSMTAAAPQLDFSKLLVCIAIDIIGTSSELVPLVGEITDVVWAPIAALALRSLYGNSNVLFALEFTEEILPFTDILPLATLCWVVDAFFADSDLAKLLQIGDYSNVVVNVRDTSAIDVKAKEDVETRKLGAGRSDRDS